MKPRALCISATVTVGIASVLAACSSFGSAANTADSGSADATPPIADVGVDTSPATEEAGASDAASIADAAFDCRDLLVDTFDGRAPNGNWRPGASSPGLQGDYTNQTASFTLPAGTLNYVVLNGPPFFDGAADSVEPQLVSIELDLTIATLDPVGATVAQLPDLTDSGNVRIEAIPAIGGAGTASSVQLSLVANTPTTTPAATSISVAYGKKERLRWSYSRSGANRLTVTLERVGSTEAPLEIKTTTKSTTTGAYFQMGPYANRGAVSGVQVAYDNVAIRTCSKR